jgi:hypothetical protein
MLVLDAGAMPHDSALTCDCQSDLVLLLIGAQPPVCGRSNSLQVNSLGPNGIVGKCTQTQTADI